MVRIAIALPVPNSKIIGGYKVVYEYANYMVDKGCDMTIVYNAHNGDNSMHLPRAIAFLIRWRIGKYGPKWFKLDPRIHKKVLKCFNKDSFNNYDIVIATAAETAEYINSSKINPNNKWYFVQDFEDWGRSKEEVIDTYKMDMNIITISKWLKNIIEESSKKNAIYIPNGIEKKVFRIIKPYDSRGKHTVSALYHWDDRKGCDITLKILYRLRENYDDFEAYLFGAPSRESDWPSWIHYTQKATPQEVSNSMNEARVFLCTSRQEGFGLTGLESIFCGCTLVTTDCKGIREYASDDNSYLCKVDDDNMLFESVCKAFDNEEEALLKRKNCDRVISGFDSELSKKAFYENIIKNL